MRPPVSILCLLASMVAVLSCGDVAACPSPVGTTTERKTKIVSERPKFGELIIGAYYDRDDVPREFIRIKESGCYAIARKLFGDRPVMSVWIATRDRPEDWILGSFVYVHITRIEKQAYREKYTFFRNRNLAPLDMTGSKIAWLPKKAPAEAGQPAITSDPFVSPLITDELATRLLTTVDRTEFDSGMPGFLRNLVAKEDVRYEDRYDLWPYVLRSRPSKDFLARLEKLNGYNVKLHAMAVSFETKDQPIDTFLAKPVLEISTRGPCHYITIDSPNEEFQKTVALRFDDDDAVECPAG